VGSIPGQHDTHCSPVLYLPAAHAAQAARGASGARPTLQAEQLPARPAVPLAQGTHSDWSLEGSSPSPHVPQLSAVPLAAYVPTPQAAQLTAPAVA
jgi:hypothetical protein